MIERNYYISLLERWKNKQVIKVVTGIRRCGKSTLMRMFRDKLLSEGVSSSHIISLNLEDIDNEEYLNYKELYSFVKGELQKSGMNYLFLDEIQMVEDFQKAIASLQLIENLDIYLTGSNAYLLSGEIATLLSGRYVEIEMYPLSFKEFLSTQLKTESLEVAYKRYIEFGAFPYVTQLGADRTLIRDYLSGLYNTIVLKDVVARRKVSDVIMLENVVSFLTDNIGNISVVKRISDTMTSAGRKISSHTVESYLSALLDSYIFYSASRYDIKGKQYLKSGSKLYLADMGLRNIIIGTRTGDLGHILENVIFMELRRRGNEVYVGKFGETEVDFIAVNSNMRVYYQVALSVRESETLNRELSPLMSIPGSYPKYLLTMDNDPVVIHDGIIQMFALDWLLDEPNPMNKQ